MLDTLLQICNKLGVDYPDIDNYLSECQKMQYLLDRIAQFIA